jgi:ribonuclease-3
VADRFFFMPRFVRDLSENGKEILSMNEVIGYLLKSYKPVIDEMDLMQASLQVIPGVNPTTFEFTTTTAA